MNPSTTPEAVGSDAEPKSMDTTTFDDGTTFSDGTCFAEDAIETDAQPEDTEEEGRS